MCLAIIPEIALLILSLVLELQSLIFYEKKCTNGSKQNIDSNINSKLHEENTT